MPRTEVTLRLARKLAPGCGVPASGLLWSTAVEGSRMWRCRAGRVFQSGAVAELRVDSHPPTRRTREIR